MIFRKLVYFCLLSAIPLTTLPVGALEPQLLDYREIAQPQCRQAIQEVERKLNTYNVRLITNRFNTGELGYNQAPQGSVISFWMAGDATRSILMSEKMMLTLSTQIINSCARDRIIGVDFAQRNSGWIIRFGVVNGSIRKFDSLDASSDCDGEMRWGTICVS